MRTRPGSVSLGVYNCILACAAAGWAHKHGRRTGAHSVDVLRLGLRPGRWHRAQHCHGGPGGTDLAPGRLGCAGAAGLAQPSRSAGRRALETAGASGSAWASRDADSARAAHSRPLTLAAARPRRTRVGPAGPGGPGWGPPAARHGPLGRVKPAGAARGVLGGSRPSQSQLDTRRANSSSAPIPTRERRTDTQTQCL